MRVQVFVGRTTLSMENELRRLKLISITEDPTLNEILESEHSKEQFAEKLLRELQYTEFYCFRGVSVASDNEVLSESSPPS
jgi:hypothetical protein